MSIYAYTGLPGSGKSYNAVEQIILTALKAGRRVVTNVPLYVEKIREQITTGELVEFPVQSVAQDPDSIKDFVTAGSVFVLDEVWRLWPQGQKADEVPEAFKSLLAEHRHMVDAQGNSVSIVLLVQDLANIGAFARRLVEQTFIHTKLGHVGMNKRFRVDIYQGQVTGVTGPVKKRLREIYGSYKPEICGLYKSHTMSQAAADGANEKHVDARGNVLKKPMLIVGALSVPLLLWYGIHTLMNLREKYYHPESTAAVSAAVGEQKQRTASPSSLVTSSFVVNPEPQKRAEPELHWRIVGWVKNEDRPSMSFVYLRNDDGHIVRQPYGNCRVFADEPLSCELEGKYYSETGKQELAGINKPL